MHFGNDGGLDHCARIASVSKKRKLMAALCSRCGHYIFAMWFLSIYLFYFTPNLSDCRLDVYHSSTHDVALVRI